MIALRLPPALIADLDRWQAHDSWPSRAELIRYLIDGGIRAIGEEQKREAKRLTRLDRPVPESEEPTLSRSEPRDVRSCCSMRSTAILLERGAFAENQMSAPAGRFLP